MSILSLSFGAACIVQGFRQYWNDEERMLRKGVEFAFQRAGLFVKTKNGKNEHVDLYKFREMNRMPNGWYLEYLMPVGITLDDIDKSKRIIEGATYSEMVAWMDGQILHMELYTEKIPDRIGYHDELFQSELPLALLTGFGRRGKEWLDYTKLPNPHMLVAGMSGMGKSNCLNWLVLQLIRNKNVALFMGDPKRVEFSCYEGIAEQVEKEPLKITKMITSLVAEMKKREKVLEQSGYKNIFQYNDDPTYTNMKFIYLFIDEIADFPIDDDKFWNPMIEISRKGRATGIYLVVATQRPSADIFPPSFKSNLGMKIAFRTATLSNSRVLIDTDAAFKLPMKVGRAILDVGVQREIQIPEVKEKQLQAILAHIKGDSNGPKGTD